MKVTSYREFREKCTANLIEECVGKIEAQINSKMFTIYSNHTEVIIDREYDKHTRDAVAALYKNSGWTAVHHQTSTENGERGGLTSFKFYFNE